MASDTRKLVIAGGAALLAYIVLKGMTPAGAATAGASPCGFIPGYRYVARRADGTFEVVWNGSLRGVFADQMSAERFYNSLCGG